MGGRGRPAIASCVMTTGTVLFDLDDTLFDHRFASDAALDRVRERHACLQTWPLPELKRRHSLWLERLHLEVLAGRLAVDEARLRRFQELFAEAGEALSREAALEVAMAYRRAYLDHWQAVAGAVELLAHLSQRARVGVVTNNIVSEQLEKLRACGLEPYVDTVVISEEAGAAKPDARIFEIALARLGSGVAEAVMVGDAWVNDIHGARAAGLLAVWFNRFGAPCPEPGVVTEIVSLEPAEAVAELLLAGIGTRLPGA